MLNLSGCTCSIQTVNTDQLVREQLDTKRHVTVSNIHVHNIMQQKTDKQEKIHCMANIQMPHHTHSKCMSDFSGIATTSGQAQH